MVSYPYLNTMHELLNQLAFSLFQKKLVQDCSPEELNALVKKYPYYPITQLLYAAKLKEINSSSYHEELQKTSLYFNNPLWLNFLLASKTSSPVAIIQETISPEIPYEDSNNDELVVENSIHSYRIEKDQPKETVLSTPIETAKTEEPALVFEPYHTVDYFASQGIKPVQEEKPKDRFGQQLRSFTEWLKALKSVPPQDIAKQVDQKAEETVIHLADHSIEDRNVVTEAMAEVWIKQSQPEKAIAIYNKLSLLNPSKSSYFAGLIEKLKKN